MVEDIYTATLTAQIFQAIIAIVVAFGPETYQYDVVNAFANAILPIPIPCQCVEGYEHSRYVLQVLKALYRLKTSLILWYKDFTTMLEEDLSLNPILESNCLFINN